MIPLTCTQCGRQLRLNDKLAGKYIKCPQCQTVLAVPGLAPNSNLPSSDSAGSAAADRRRAGGADDGGELSSTMRSYAPHAAGGDPPSHASSASTASTDSLAEYVLPTPPVAPATPPPPPETAASQGRTDVAQPAKLPATATISSATNSSGEKTTADTPARERTTAERVGGRPSFANESPAAASSEPPIAPVAEPPVATSATTGDEIHSSDFVDQWHVKTDDGEAYGPVTRAELDMWVEEGRLNAECQILQEGSDQWQWADTVYPQLAESPSSADHGSVEMQSPDDSSTGRAAASLATAADADGASAASPTAKTGSKTTATTAAKSVAKTVAPASSAPDSATSSSDIGGSFASESVAEARKGRIRQATVRKSDADTLADESSEELSDRRRVTAGLLGLFLGGFGAHRFYLGHVTLGVIMAVTGGGCGVWALVDAIMIFMGKVKDIHGRPLRD